MFILSSKAESNMYIIKILNKLIFIKNLLIINNTQNFYNIDNKSCYIKICNIFFHIL